VVQKRDASIGGDWLTELVDSNGPEGGVISGSQKGGTWVSPETEKIKHDQADAREAIEKTASPNGGSKSRENMFSRAKSLSRDRTKEGPTCCHKGAEVLPKPRHEGGRGRRAGPPISSTGGQELARPELG